MGQVSAVTSREVAAEPDVVYTAITDYTTTRPRMLTEHYRDYEVRAGGQGAGTQVHYLLQATSKRVRDCLITAEEPAPLTLVERDGNSSMVTTWTVAPAGTGRSTVTVSTTWRGAGGIGGFFEKTFAPAGLRRIHDGVLANLDNVVRTV